MTYQDYRALQDSDIYGWPDDSQMTANTNAVLCGHFANAEHIMT